MLIKANTRFWSECWNTRCTNSKVWTTYEGMFNIDGYCFSSHHWNLNQGSSLYNIISVFSDIG